MLVFARLWPVGVRVRVSFTTEAVRSAILASAGLLVKSILCVASRGKKRNRCQCHASIDETNYEALSEKTIFTEALLLRCYSASVGHCATVNNYRDSVAEFSLYIYVQ